MVVATAWLMGVSAAAAAAAARLSHFTPSSLSFASQTQTRLAQLLPGHEDMGYTTRSYDVRLVYGQPEMEHFHMILPPGKIVSTVLS